MSGLYLHIPFCKSKCRYCDFFSKVIKDNGLKNRYINALCKEIFLQKNYLGLSKIKTVYFGGGTPSVLNLKQIEKIFNCIFDVFDLHYDNEITFEANPENLTYNFLFSLKKYTPVNRLSIGFQSFNDKELSFLNRKHNTKTSLLAVENAQKIGFENITGDLIYGLPNQTLQNWINNLNVFFKTGVRHLSAYHLTIEEGTVFGNWLKKGKITEIDDNLSLKMFKCLVNLCAKNNFFHYEISNFAKKNFQAVHNKSYWFGEKYLGVGASAHSFNINSRQWNVANIKKYINFIEKDKIPAQKEILSDIDKFNELLITGLRTFWGIKIDFLKSDYLNFYKKIESSISKYIKKGLMEFSDNSLKLTIKGKFISDTIISDLLIV